VKWLEDELELNALHNPGSRRGSGNEKAAVAQKTAFSAALGGRVEVAAMSTISGQCFTGYRSHISFGSYNISLQPIIELFDNLFTSLTVCHYQPKLCCL
jgi:hypothetical protein